MNDIKILSDNPEIENEKIKFDFIAYRNTFVDIITGNQNETPLVIGLEGRWGRGKTTLMKAIRSERQRHDKEKILDGKRRCKTVWFQAWKYNDADYLLAALLEEIVQEMWQGNFFEKAEIAINTVWNKINLKAVPEFLTNFIPFLKGCDKIIKEEDYKKNLPYFTLFNSFLKQLIGLWIHAEDSFKFKKEKDILPGEINDKKGVLVIFIDDLNLQIKISEYKGLKEKLEVKDHIYWSILKEAYRESFEAIKLNPKIIPMAKDEYKKYEEEIGNNNLREY